VSVISHNETIIGAFRAGSDRPCASGPRVPQNAVFQVPSAELTEEVKIDDHAMLSPGIGSRIDGCML
jgi:hypothetical protein